jgi:hypothetical protein
MIAQVFTMVVLLVGWVACSQTPVAPPAADPAPMPQGISDDPEREPPPPPRFVNPQAGRFHMRRHFDDLRMIERLFIAGKLDEGATLADLLVRQTDDPGMAPWDLQAKQVAEAAEALSKAPGLDEALRRAARVAAACADCHAQAQGRPVFAAVPPVPPDAPTRAARMARHVWATDRLWEGMIGPDDDRWKRGLEVLAATPQPFMRLTEAPGFARRLQQLARDQLAARATTGIDDRARAYGEMLVTCAACHSSLHVELR